MKFIISTLLGIGMAIGGMLGFQQAPLIYEAPDLGATNVLPIAGQTYTLAGSGVSSSATSLTLTSFTLPQNGYKIQDSDVSSTFYVTLEPGSRTRQEIVSCTTVTQNANTTATLSGCIRGLSPVTPYTASSTLQFAHAGGTQLIFSDPPQLFNQFVAKDNDGNVSGTINFYKLPTSTSTPANNQDLATKSYVDGVSVAGAANATEAVKGISELAAGTDIASSTLAGATSARLTVGANLFSGSCTSATTTALATKTNGKINSNCFDSFFRIGTSTPWKGATIAFEQSGASIPWLVGDTGTSTPLAYISPKGALVIASTTPTSGSTLGTKYKLIVNGSSSTNGLTIPTLGGLDSFSFDKVLTSNSTGAVSAQSIASLNTWELITASTTQVSSANSTSEQTIFGYTIPANSLGPNGMIHIVLQGQMTSSANNKVFTVYWGGRAGTTVNGFTYTTGTGTWRVEDYISNRNATNSQITSNLFNNGGSQAVNEGSVTASRDTTANQDITVTVAKATGTETFTVDYGFIEIMKRP